MENNFEIIWILNKTGLCYIQRIFDLTSITSMDENLFSGLITSIMMFSKNIFEESFEKLTMGSREIFIKPFSSVIVALAAKRDTKGLNDKDIFFLLDEIGQAFQVEYADFLNSNVVNVTRFKKFGAIIDRICGLETFIYLEEHDKLISLLKHAEVNNLDEPATVKELLHFLEDLDDYKLEIILETTGDILKPFLGNKNVLTPSQKKKYAKIFH